MSYINAMFIRKKTIDSKEGGKRRSLLVTNDSAKIKDLQDQLNIEKHKTSMIEEKILKSEQSLSLKLEEYQKEIKKLREQITYCRLHPTPTSETINQHIDEAENLHQKVIFAINDFKNQIDRQLRDQEKDTIKRFDLKLAKICNEIEERKKKRIMELSSMANTEKKVAKDLENLRESSILIDRKNQLLEQDNARLESLISAKESEYQNLIQTYYYAKRRLKPIENSSKTETKAPKTANVSFTCSETSEDKTDRYENVISKLRKQLENERKNLKNVRIAYAQEMDDRTEMENVVRRTIEEIREQLAQRSRNPSAGEERAILIDRLVNSIEVATLLNKNPYQNESQEDINI